MRIDIVLDTKRNGYFSEVTQVDVDRVLFRSAHYKTRQKAREAADKWITENVVTSSVK